MGNLSFISDKPILTKYKNKASNQRKIIINFETYTNFPSHEYDIRVFQLVVVKVVVVEGFHITRERLKLTL